MDATGFDPLRLENQLCFPLYACSRQVVKKYHPFLEELDLTYTQYIAMMVLWEHRQVTSKLLGEKLRAAGYRVEALAPVSRMAEGVIEFL